MGLGTRLDARQNPRFLISAPILFTWRERADVLRDESGMTYNLSIKGMYVSTSECPSLDALIEFVVQLPRFNDDCEPLTIKSQGRVTRVDYAETGSAPSGFSFCGGPWGILDSEEETVDTIAKQ